MNAFIPHAHPQALHLLQQQQQQQAQPQPTPPIIPVTHAQNAAALYQQYYQSQFANMPQFINATPQQMTVGVMGAQMIPSQPLIGAGPNTSSSNNGGSSGMTTPNSSVSGGPTYKVNNQAHSGDNGNTGANNVPSKKAVVSVQRPEQSNVPPQQQQQQQQIPGTAQMIFPAAPIRYYSPDYLTQRKQTEYNYFVCINYSSNRIEGAPPSMPLQQIPFYYQVNPSGLIQTTNAAGQPQNIMISQANSSAGSVNPGLTPLHYGGVYAGKFQ